MLDMRWYRAFAAAPNALSKRGLLLTSLLLLLSPASLKPQTTDTSDRWAVRTDERTQVSPQSTPNYFPFGVERTRCGSLQYFQGKPDPFEFEAELTVPQATMIRDAVELQRVGLQNGFLIYWVVHRITYAESLPTYIKMILVQRTPGEFCEIFNEQGYDDGVQDLTAPFFVEVGSQTVLANRDPVNGSCACFQDGYWTFDKDGPVFLDVWNLIDDAEKKFVPAGFDLWHSDFDIRTLTCLSTFRSRTPANTNAHSTLVLKFILKDHKLVLIGHTLES